MKMLPLYTNLDTSFVNLSALLRYLRGQNFSGLVVVRLPGYQGKITFKTGSSTSVEEHDQIAGRIAEGDEALQRLLIRARAAGGTINVLEATDEATQNAVENSPVTENPSGKSTIAPPGAPGSNSKKNPKKISLNPPPKDFLNLKPENQAPLSLEFTNQVENRARRKQVPFEDWQTFLRLVGELFGAVDNALNDAGVDFPALMRSAQTEISGDYPFLNPVSGAFHYSHGKAEMAEQINVKLFAASINEILRAVLERLTDNPNLSEVYRTATQKILALIHQHQSLYEKFFITPRLHRIIGV